MTPFLATSDSASIGLLHDGLSVGAILFAVGMVGLLARRNLIVMFLSAELMLQGISVSLVSWSRFHGDFGGHVLVVLVLTVAACEAAVALVFVLRAFESTGRLDSQAWQSLREEDLPRVIDQEIPEIDSAPPVWPRLTPAGVEPPVDHEAILQREHV
jgi:NADH-quinone oxidoreductase subunit K